MCCEMLLCFRIVGVKIKLKDFLWKDVKNVDSHCGDGIRLELNDMCHALRKSPPIRLEDSRIGMTENDYFFTG